ncbi:MAG: MoxR family ATPase [Deltaproteobacteria bacterium]|nr:MoxR family ATPase [Deltaproteobacteria bacterium]MCL5277986.1 MoxR family ATPase [Deltaproteobacteria bacterium]
MNKIRQFKSPGEITALLKQAEYISNEDISTAVYIAGLLSKPLLIEGQPGVGKTEFAKSFSRALGLELIRLQCYEGIDDTKAVYEWEYSKQLLYAQLLKGKIDEILGDAADLSSAMDRLKRFNSTFFSEEFIIRRPLLRAISSPEPVVLLIDEVDKSEPSFEALLLEVLSDYQISIPEIGTMKAKSIPFVVLTSNNARDLSDELRRRCIYLYMNMPDSARQMEIVRTKLSTKVSDDFLDMINGMLSLINAQDLKRPPSLSEIIDWSVSIASAGIDREHVSVSSLGSLLKDESDQQKAFNALWKPQNR